MKKLFKIKRQDSPEGQNYWEEFEMVLPVGATLIQVLEQIRLRPITVNQQAVNPVAWDSCCHQAICGSCAMTVNGRPVLACSTVVEDLPEPVVVEPLSSFGVMRDLVVTFDGARQVAFLDGARQAAPLRNVTPTPCIDCNVCMEACPQYGNSDYVGPKVLYQMAEGLKQGLETRLATSVIKSLMNEGGVDDCQNAQNCVQVCPQKLPLTESIAYLKREVAIQAFKELFR